MTVPVAGVAKALPRAVTLVVWLPSGSYPKVHFCANGERCPAIPLSRYPAIPLSRCPAAPLPAY